MTYSMKVPDSGLRLTEADKLHADAILLGAIAAGATVPIFVVWALVTSNPIQLLNAIGPGVLALVCLAMLRKRWYHAEGILIFAALSTVFSYKFFGGEGTSTPAAIGVVVVVSIGALFMDERWKWPYVWLGSFGLLATGVFWQGWTSDALWIGISGSLSGLVAMVLFIRMMDTAVASDRRYRILVEKVPLPLLEQDWSAVHDWIEERRKLGITDIDEHLDAHPEALDYLVSRIRVRAANPAISHMVADSDDYSFDSSINHSNLLPFVRNEVIALWNDAEPAASDYRMERNNGEEFWARIQGVGIDSGLIDGVDRLIVATNVTELKETQAELAEQVRSKDEFIATVSHELRTPLTTVLGFAELIADEATRLPESTREMLTHLVGQATITPGPMG